MSRNDIELDSPEAEAALRDIMSNSVSGIRMPPGLADRAVGRNRRRKARIRLTGTVSAVAATAAVAAAVIVPGQLEAVRLPGRRRQACTFRPPPTFCARPPPRRWTRAT